MKIKEEQLNKIKDQQEKLTDLVNKIGLVETQKHALLHDIAKVNVEIEDYKQEIEKEYGSISINLEDGTYSEINDPYGKNE
mgnify:CR=1 FL=1